MSGIFDLEQTSYWLLLVWLFGGAVLLLGMPKKRELVCGRVQVRWYWTNAILLVLPYILWTGYRTGGADTYPYMRAFQASTAVLSDIPKVMASDAKDPGFSALMILVKACGINDYQVFFLLVAAFQMWCIVYTFRKYSSNFWISIFLFVASTDYMSWMQNGIRQFIAVCMTFAAFDWLIHKKYARFVIVVLIASQIHGSAIIMIPLAFIMQGKALNRQTMLIIVGAALCVPFIDRFTPVISDLMATESASRDRIIMRWAIFFLPICVQSTESVPGILPSMKRLRQGLPVFQPVPAVQIFSAVPLRQSKQPDVVWKI